MPSLPPQRPDNLAARLFPPRQILIRSAYGYDAWIVSTRTQLLAALFVYLGAAAAAFGVTGYLSGQTRVALAPERVEAPEQVADADRRARDLAEARLRQMVAELARTGSQQQETIESLTELRDTLERELRTTQEELKAVADERDAARQAAEREEDRQVVAAAGAARPEGRGGAQAQAQTESDARATAALAERLAQVEARLIAAVGERDRLARNERGLRWRVEMLETRLADMRQSVSAEAGRLRQWIVNQVSSLEGVLATSGIDVDRLIRRVDTRLSSGQGGPLEPVALLAAPRRGERPAFPPLSEEMSRLRAVHALLQSMPLVPPMAAYRTTSGFGVRRDPLTGRPAMHAGLDFGGPDDAPVLATAAGRVVSAGRAGAYGLMVEVDHGMGIRTRYGHLKELLVARGDRVVPRQPVGVMGSTGRSTGDHLHYEVRVDGVAFDPAQFLEAGRQLKNVFKG